MLVITGLLFFVELFLFSLCSSLNSETKDAKPSVGNMYQKSVFPSAPNVTGFKIVPINNDTAKVILSLAPHSEHSTLAGYHLFVDTKYCERRLITFRSIQRNYSKNASDIQVRLLFFQCPYNFTLTALPENPLDRGKSSVAYTFPKLVLDHNYPAPVMASNITLSPDPDRDMYVITVEWLLRRAESPYLANASIVVAYSIVPKGTKPFEHSTPYPTKLSVNKLQTVKRGVTTADLRPLRPGASDIFLGPLDYSVLIYQLRENEEWYHKISPVDKIFQAPPLLPGPVTNVSVDFVVYNNISQSVHFVLTWAPPSAPHGKILHFRISVEEVSSVADGSISTRTFITAAGVDYVNLSVSLENKMNSLYAQVWAVNKNGDGQASAPILVYDGSQHLDVNMTSPTGLQEDLWGVMGVLGLMPVAVAIIVTVIVFVKLRRRRLRGGVKQLVTNYFLVDDSEKNRGSVVIEKNQLLGRGHFGEVYFGVYNSQKVAVKVLKEGSYDKEELLHELEVMKTVCREDHPHVISLIAYCTHTPPVLFIMELAPMGSLLTYLRRRNGYAKGNRSVCYLNLFPKDYKVFAIECCLQIARGMEFLASKHIAHCDLAARNVLLGEEGLLKISDFGNARFSYDTCHWTINALPIRWMSPEAFSQGEFSEKSDMWSFGVVIWEIYSFGEVPYPDILPNTHVITHVQRGGRLNRPQECPRDMYRTMESMWDEQPRGRPTFAETVSTLEETRNGLQNMD